MATRRLMPAHWHWSRVLRADVPRMREEAVAGVLQALTVGCCSRALHALQDAWVAGVSLTECREVHAACLSHLQHGQGTGSRAQAARRAVWFIAAEGGCTSAFCGMDARSTRLAAATAALWDGRAAEALDALRGVRIWDALVRQGHGFDSPLADSSCIWVSSAVQAFVVAACLVDAVDVVRSVHADAVRSAATHPFAPSPVPLVTHAVQHALQGVIMRGCGKMWDAVLRESHDAASPFHGALPSGVKGPTDTLPFAAVATLRAPTPRMLRALAQAAGPQAFLAGHALVLRAALGPSQPWVTCADDAPSWDVRRAVVRFALASLSRAQWTHVLRSTQPPPQYLALQWQGMLPCLAHGMAAATGDGAAAALAAVLRLHAAGRIPVLPACVAAEQTLLVTACAAAHQHREPIRQDSVLHVLASQDGARAPPLRACLAYPDAIRALVAHRARRRLQMVAAWQGGRAAPPAA